MSTRCTAVLTLTALGLTLGACRERDAVAPCPQPARLLVPSLDTILVGTARPFFIVQSHGHLTWSTTDASVATVDANGVATAQAQGSVQISAIDDDTPVNCPTQWYAVLVVR